MSAETRELIHAVLIVLIFPLGALISVWYAPRYGYTRKKALSYAMTVNVLVVLFSFALTLTAEALGYAIGLNAYRSYLFLPLITLTVSRIWKIPMLHGADFMTPIMFFERTMVVIGCNVQGCANAIACDWGQYSPSMGCRVFPMDLIDLIGNLAVSIISLLYAKKLNYKGEGRVFALSMYLLAIVRAAIQFGCSERWWNIRGINDETLYSVVAVITALLIYRNYSASNKDAAK